MAEAEKNKIELDPNPESVRGATPEYVEAWQKKFGKEQAARTAELAEQREEAARQQREANAPAEATGEAQGEGSKGGDK